MQLILASHGELANGIKSALNVIFADNIPVKVDAFGLNTGENVEDLFNQVNRCVESADEVIILTDVLGGSVDNELSKLATKDGVNLITGMNLPLVLQLCIGGSNSLVDVDVDNIINSAKDGILSKTDLLKSLS